MAIEITNIDDVVKLYNANLISKEEARAEVNLSQPVVEVRADSSLQDPAKVAE